MIFFGGGNLNYSGPTKISQPSSSMWHQSHVSHPRDITKMKWLGNYGSPCIRRQKVACTNLWEISQSVSHKKALFNWNIFVFVTFRQVVWYIIWMPSCSPSVLWPPSLPRLYPCLDTSCKSPSNDQGRPPPPPPPLPLPSLTSWSRVRLWSW